MYAFPWNYVVCNRNVTTLEENSLLTEAVARRNFTFEIIGLSETKMNEKECRFLFNTESRATF